MKKQKKSGTTAKREKRAYAPRPPGAMEGRRQELLNVLTEEHGKARRSLRLMLRVIAWLMQHRDEWNASEAKIPLGALNADIDVGIVQEDDRLIVVPAPPTLKQCFCTRQETSFEPNRGGHIVSCPAWGTAQPNEWRQNIPALVDLLALVDVFKMTDEATERASREIATWDPPAYESALAWAEVEHAHASDNVVVRLDEPPHVTALRAPVVAT